MPGPEVAVKDRAPFHPAPDGDPDGRQLVFGLDDGAKLAAVLVDTEPAHMLFEKPRPAMWTA